MEITVDVRENDAGGQDYVIVGDHQAFYWLLSAAGPARDGFEGNLAELTDGSGDRLVLEPESANGVRGSQLARRRARSPRPIDDPSTWGQAGTPVGLEIPRQLVDDDRDKALELITKRLEHRDDGDTVIVIRGEGQPA